MIEQPLTIYINVDVLISYTLMKNVCKDIQNIGKVNQIHLHITGEEVSSSCDFESVYTSLPELFAVALEFKRQAYRKSTIRFSTYPCTNYRT